MASKTRSSAGFALPSHPAVLQEAERIPSSRSLATMLRINRNTVAQAYRELTFDGYLKRTVGSGTVVAGSVQSQNTPGLARLVQQALEETRRMGLSEEQLLDELVAAIAARAAERSQKRVLVVDCKAEAIEHIRTRIETELGAATVGALIQELQENPEEDE